MKKTMSPFVQTKAGKPDPNEISRLAQRTGQTFEQVKAQVDVAMAVPMFTNNVYTVLKSFTDGIWGPMWHLSISRNDKKAVHSWSDFQEIKNMLVGEANEGVELYPAQSRAMDDDNQYHLYVFMDPGKIMPIGVATFVVKAE